MVCHSPFEHRGLRKPLYCPLSFNPAGLPLSLFHHFPTICLGRGGRFLGLVFCLGLNCHFRPDSDGHPLRGFSRAPVVSGLLSSDVRRAPPSHEPPMRFRPHPEQEDLNVVPMCLGSIDREVGFLPPSNNLQGLLGGRRLGDLPLRAHPSTTAPNIWLALQCYRPRCSYNNTIAYLCGYGNKNITRNQTAITRFMLTNLSENVLKSLGAPDDSAANFKVDIIVTVTSPEEVTRTKE